MKPLFIVFDGIDGSGKGEVIVKIEKYLREKNITVLITYEPSDGEYSKEIRILLKNDISPKDNANKLLEMYIKDRKEHLEKTILPFLSKESKERRIVLCDRYYYSTIAYQSAQGIDTERLIELNKDFVKPDITFILDLPVDLAMKRISERERNVEKFEKIEFMRKVKENFLRLNNFLDDNIKIINAGSSKEEVFEKVRKEIDTLM
jgi:dTMP kinase